MYRDATESAGSNQACEKWRIPDGKAEYVISRLQVPSSVHFSSRQGDELESTRVMKGKKGLPVDYGGLAATSDRMSVRKIELR